MCFIFFLLAQGNDFDFEANILLDPAMDFQFPVEFLEEATPEKCTSGSRTDVNVLDNMIGNATCSSDSPSNPIYVQSETIHEENIESHHHLLEEQKGTLPATAIGRTSDDGYNWRKYGKKLIKGSKHPRSYYKCNHENCLVKKKIECAHDGQITGILYKGTHNHPQPQPGSGAPPGPASSLYEMPEMGEGGNSVKVKGGSVQKNRESGSKDIKVHDGKVDGLERTSSTSVVTEFSDPLSAAQVKSVGTSESTETPELSSTLASHDDDDDGVTQGSSFSVDVDDESESKRRYPV
jgi:WRKY transcription factor 2